ncbi:MAG: YebC/PmpR family DNA-binding transcriptional regulator, partial [Candidatus Omnitrophica bacterium]|nr:YebC/PmpR family DNA-binding transcriptional regulator [Candidatus Omnitrophota bacterium]
EISTQPKKFESVKKAIEDCGIEISSSEVTLVPDSTVNISDKGTAQQVLGLINALEDNDDVQNVYANFDIPDNILSEIEL